MPYVNIKITREEVTSQQKAEPIKGVTDLLVHVLNKTPATTFVVIDEGRLGSCENVSRRVSTTHSEPTKLKGIDRRDR